MEDKKGKGGLVVGLLIGIIIMLVVGIGLFATNIISFNNAIKDNKNTDNKNTIQEENNENDVNVDFDSFLADVSSSLGHLVVLHSVLPQYGERKNNDYIKNIDDKQTMVMEYILKDKNNEKNFVKVSGITLQKDDSLDVRHETTIAYYPYNLFNAEYKKLFGEDFNVSTRITSVGEPNEYDKSLDYVYYINRRAGLNGMYVSDMNVDNTTKNDDSYTITVNMTYSDRLSEKLGVKIEKAEMVCSVSNGNISLKSFIVK